MLTLSLSIDKLPGNEHARGPAPGAREGGVAVERGTGGANPGVRPAETGV